MRELCVALLMWIKAIYDDATSVAILNHLCIVIYNLQRLFGNFIQFI